MGERTILVCDTCGKPATETVTIKIGRGNFVKDLCDTHVKLLVVGARKPRPGRRKGVVAAAVAAAPKAARKAASKAAPKRRGRPPKKKK